MESKKTPNANLENKKFALFLVGLVASLALVLVAIEARSAMIGDRELPQEKKGLDDEEVVEVIIQQEIVPPPPPPPPPPQPEEIKVVDNKEEVKVTNFTASTEDEPIKIVEVKKEEPKIEEIVEVPDVMAEFPGGIEKMYEYLGKNIKYPQIAKESGVQGKVYVQFVVEKDGTITDVKVVRGIGSGCDDEAKRVVEKMPKWNAGEQKGKAVRSRFTLPVKYELK